MKSRSAIGSQWHILTHVLHNRYYYQGTIDRLEACPLTIHGMAHIPDDIVDTGPIWTTWTFMMERFAGSLLSAVKSKKKPNRVLALHVRRGAQLNVIKWKYNLDKLIKERFGGAEGAEDNITSKEKVYANCTSLLCSRLQLTSLFRSDDCSSIPA